MLKELGYNADIFQDTSFFDASTIVKSCESACETCMGGCPSACQTACITLCIVGCKITGSFFPCVLMF